MNNRLLLLLFAFLICLTSIGYSQETNDSIDIDTLEVFSKEVENEISTQLIEIWSCKAVKFALYSSDSTKLKKEIIVDIGTIPKPNEERLEGFKYATREILNKAIRTHNYRGGFFIYESLENDKTEKNKFHLFEVLNSIPLVGNCTYELNQIQRKNCFKEYVYSYFDQNFDPEEFKNIGLEKKRHNLTIQFAINEQGQVDSINIIHENEIIRQKFAEITKRIDVTAPGYSNGKPELVRYSIPMHFTLD